MTVNVQAHSLLVGFSSRSARFSADAFIAASRSKLERFSFHGVGSEYVEVEER